MGISLGARAAALIGAGIFLLVLAALGVHNLWVPAALLAAAGVGLGAYHWLVRRS